VWHRYLFVLLGLALQGLAAADERITVLGIDSTMDVLERWASTERTVVSETANSWVFKIDRYDLTVFAPKPDVPLPALASAMYQSDIAVVAMDALVGPTPALRDYIIAARQAEVPLVAAILANVESLKATLPMDARELLALEDVEVRALLSLYEVGDENTLVFYDSYTDFNVPDSTAGGIDVVSSTLMKNRVPRSPYRAVEKQRTALATVYFLAQAESNGYGISISEPTPLQMWSEGVATNIELLPDYLISPGDTAEIIVDADTFFAGQRGSRIILFDDNHVIGIGVLTKVHFSANGGQ